jgi:hypothetical protein
MNVEIRTVAYAIPFLGIFVQKALVLCRAYVNLMICYRTYHLHPVAVRWWA